MGTEIDGKVHRAAAPSDKIALSPDGFTTAQEVADLGTGGGGQTLVIANDEDVTVAANRGTMVVLYTALTAARVVNLPPASSPSMTVIVKDALALATGVNTITLNAHAGDDTFLGGFPVLQTNGGGVGLVVAFSNDGVSKWAKVSDATDQLVLVEDALNRAGALTPPSGGSTIDSQARASIAAIINALGL